LNSSDGGSKFAWRNKELDPKTRLDLLMAEMTLEEKVAQLGSIWLGFGEHKQEQETKNQTDNVPVIDEVSKQPAFEDVTKHGLGHLTRVWGTKPIEPLEGLKRVVELQKKVVERNRLGIPATVHEECLTGFATMGATTYPTPLGLAAGFNPEIIRAVGRAIGEDLRAAGVHHALSPVVDIVRDYRWGRVEETMGEDPILASRSGTAYVQGIQDAGVVATLKHFAGHSFSRAARNHGPVSAGWREMRDVYIKPFAAAIKYGPVGSVMNSYTDVDGEPCASSTKLMNDVLRDELGFEGTVVSDYWSISFLELMHRVAGSPQEAGILALKAGIDVELPSTRCYGDLLVDAVRSGLIEESYVDRSCRRVLAQKFAQGLLDAGWNADDEVVAASEFNLDSTKNRQVAKQAALEGIILLANPKDLLPLKSDFKTVALVGPCSDDGAAFLGCYSFANHVMSQHPGMGLGIEVPTIKDVLQERFPEVKINHLAGVPVKNYETAGIAAARQAVEGSDLAIIVVGDRAGLFGEGTSGEGNDVKDLRLPGAQQDLLDACLETQTDCIVISVSGRPYYLGPNIDSASAVIQAFMPGQEGASALLDVLTGVVSPSGRLPVQIPDTTSGQPSTYLEPKYGMSGLGMSPVDAIVKYPFGHGLSYSKFEYSGFQVNSDRVSATGSVAVSLLVKNTGTYLSSDVVQVYFEDPVASVARPVRQLVDFKKVSLAAGDQIQVSFEISAEQFAYIGADYKRIVDAGQIKILVGKSRDNILWETDIEVLETALV
jgi:beta-glucosidase-like glycosyl hydrolase